MQKWRVIILVSLFVLAAALQQTFAQCSICTKTSMQQGDKPASGMNSGVVYLMLTPFAVVGYIGYRWWKTEKQFDGDNNG
jgi:membrane protein CcdC involved in cytochrome C biogenesis